MAMMFVIFTGLVIINAYIILNSQRCYSGTSCQTNPYSSYNIAMLSLGIIAFLLCLIYFGAFPLCVQKYITGIRTGVLYEPTGVSINYSP
jgi:hypothetical protein